MTGSQTSSRIRRGFADIAEGQVHFRTAGEDRGGTPLVMLHASPGSAKMLEPLMLALAGGRRVIGTDTLGNGDSSAPQAGDKPPITYFADAHLRALDALGLETFDLYGTHTGANIACEIAIAHPRRVRRLILDGVSLYAPEEQADMLANYAPGVTLDLNGSQLHWIWHFVRDVYLFWPWYRRDAAHRRNLGLPSAEELHDKVVEVLKAARTYHIPYNAAFAYDKSARLPLVRVPTLVACAKSDMFAEYFDRVKDLIPGSEALLTPGTGSEEGLAGTVALFEAFLNRPAP
ncbi:alpha/beta fold hydrolase [Roseomonas populi]|uniref:Alpha/beta hydrolase n=1 Tax=Roseomonas populi TaxID=3121582 RepID=A0ABT1X5C8_9PROT|nr:alpha/beta hydrolase [Roseomonas pecuniae]MCR0982593.1 alpha/beta hydrolase [Roseomonas pecuniae]